MAWWGYVLCSMLAIFCVCIILGSLGALEGKYKCIGGPQIHSFLDQNAEMHRKVHNIVDLLGFEDEDLESEDKVGLRGINCSAPHSSPLFAYPE